jgi:histidine triad (HIT) family protein
VVVHHQDEDVNDCIFCRIVAREVPADEVERTDTAIVVRDLNPQAPTHLLVIPTRHAADLGDYAATATPAELGALLQAASRAGRNASADGYRVVINEGADGGQTVGHLHLHVLAGRRMTWPPG